MDFTLLWASVFSPIKKRVDDRMSEVSSNSIIYDLKKIKVTNIDL